ncbi:hypothetical protein HZA56_00170 [Candidatus Poribacteria bacterium]|nr:hypothetical protein [Candidatus Poribacteria bacterium]
MIKGRAWGPISRKGSKPKITDTLKATVEARSNELVESVLKPRSIQPPPEDDRFNYIVDIYTKWHGSGFYFLSKYRCPGPNAIVPFFETGFARMEYAGQNRFNLSMMRHTGQWQRIFFDFTLDECLTSIRDDPFFGP